MIQLKIKKNSVDDVSPELRPYVEKIIENLKATSLDPDLVLPVEKAIRDKTTQDVEKLFKDGDFMSFKTIYLTNARHIIENLKTTNNINNQQLIETINNRTITPETLVNLDPEDMFTERWRTLVEQKLTEINKLTQAPEATTNLFRCNRCHRNQ